LRYVCFSFPSSHLKSIPLFSRLRRRSAEDNSHTLQAP
jgi:hypothetical protein